jgi:hypothetical protein
MGSDDVRAAAARVERLGDEVRRLADRALGVGALDWRSTAAAGFRDRLRDEAGRVRAAAARLDEAAEALRGHAVAVDEVAGWLGFGR